MLLQTPEQVREYCTKVAGSPFIAVDTEFQWDRTYFAKLGLLQMATPDHVGLIDCVAVDDLSPARELLCSSDGLKLFHSASQDLSILGRVFDSPVANIYDTQIANALLGGAHQAGYATLVQDNLGIEVDKSVQHTDWVKRPLDPKQLEYARDDVVLLARLFPGQQQALRECGRLEWALEDSRWLERNPPSEACHPEEAFSTIKGWGRLSPEQLRRLVALAKWREEHCRGNDIRPRWLVPDSALTGFAVKGRFHGGVLQNEKPWVAKRVRKLRPDIEAALAAAEEIPLSSLPRKERRGRPTPFEKALIDKADSFVAARASELGIEKMLLASRAEFTSLVRYVCHRGEAPEDARIVQGWRARQVGDELVRMLLAECRQRDNEDT
jgi:ribonuclease D